MKAKDAKEEERGSTAPNHPRVHARCCRLVLALVALHHMLRIYTSRSHRTVRSLARHEFVLSRRKAISPVCESERGQWPLRSFAKFSRKKKFTLRFVLREKKPVVHSRERTFVHFPQNQILVQERDLRVRECRTDEEELGRRNKPQTESHSDLNSIFPCQ